MTTSDRTPTATANAGTRVIRLLLIATFVTILNEMTMGIALPHLNIELGVPPELGQWLTSAFMLTMAVVIPVTGFVIQRYTTRQVFFAAIGTFSLGTLIALVAPGFTVLLVGRIVQAAGTGMMMPLLMTTVMNVASPQSRGRMMGQVTLVISLAPAVGPTLSGLVLDHLGWRWLFGIVLPIALVAMVIGGRLMTNLGQRTHAPIDGLSVVLSAFAFGGLVYGLTQLGSAHAPSEEATGASATTSPGFAALVAGAAVLALFVVRQVRLQRRDAALLDLRVFRSGTYTASVIVMGIAALSMFGTLTLLPQFLQNVAGLDAVQAGLVLLPGSLLMGLLGPWIGRLYDARGPRVLLVPATLLMASALYAYSTIDASTSWALIIVIQAALSVGIALAFTPAFSASLGSLQPHLYSHGSAALNTVQQVAGAAGVALLIGIYSSQLYDGAATGLSAVEAGVIGTRQAFLTAAVISSVSIVVAFFVRRPSLVTGTTPEDLVDPGNSIPTQGGEPRPEGLPKS